MEEGGEGTGLDASHGIARKICGRKGSGAPVSPVFEGIVKHNPSAGGKVKVEQERTREGVFCEQEN
jgi:hypothetical protein